MKMKEVVDIAQRVRAGSPDDRPDWLKLCRDTDHPSAMYYQFLYQLAKALRPTWTLETGTRLGLSAVQLAMGHPESTVITLDIDPKTQERLQKNPLISPIKNILHITADSRAAVKLLPAECHSFDLVYLDSDHTYDVVMPEFKLYQPMLRPGGVMIFDDITLNDGMRRFWKEVPGEKAELNYLHTLMNAGFGAYVKPEQPKG